MLFEFQAARCTEFEVSCGALIVSSFESLGQDGAIHEHFWWRGNCSLRFSDGVLAMSSLELLRRCDPVAFLSLQRRDGCSLSFSSGVLTVSSFESLGRDDAVHERF